MVKYSGYLVNEEIEAVFIKELYADSVVDEDDLNHGPVALGGLLAHLVLHGMRLAGGTNLAFKIALHFQICLVAITVIFRVALAAGESLRRHFQILVVFHLNC